MYIYLKSLNKYYTVRKNIFYEPLVSMHAAVLVKFESVADIKGGQGIVW